MTSTPAALIACESALDPILEQLTMVLHEHSGNFAGPVAQTMERLRSTTADTTIAISAALLETLGPIPPRQRWGLVGHAEVAGVGGDAGVCSSTSCRSSLALAGRQRGAVLKSLSRVLPSGLASRLLAAADADRQPRRETSTTDFSNV